MRLYLKKSCFRSGIAATDKIISLPAYLRINSTTMVRIPVKTTTMMKRSYPPKLYSIYNFFIRNPSSALNTCNLF